MSHTAYLELTLIALVCAAAVKDLMERRIPNRLLVVGLVGAFAFHLTSGEPWAAWFTGVAGAAVGLLVFLPFYCLRGMAAGDVKLMATVGAFTGAHLAVEICLATFCIGGVMALILIVTKGRLRQALRNLHLMLVVLFHRLGGMPLGADPLAGASVGNIPYGLAIAAGTLLMLKMR